MEANRELKYENSPKKKKKIKNYCGRLVLTSEGEAAV